jgi:hypothetical protein
MLLVEAEMRARETILAHYDALVVELFGARAAGYPRDRLERLVAGGYLSPDALRGLDLRRGRSDEPLNPILFVRRMGTPYHRASPERREQMRRWDLAKWQRELDNPVISTDRFSPSIEIDRPQPDELGPEPLNGAIPQGFGPAERAGLVSAFRVAGGFIRGLGVAFADEMSADIYEDWDGEELLRTPDPQRRAETLAVIREEVGAAVLTKPTAREVARRIRQRVGDLARNFDRIAETELQAVHNEGQIFNALEMDGEGARVARIPESGACESCRDLFLDPATNEPIIFEVSALAANGTNVGRRRANWLATAYPVHPNCRCDIISVGPDQRVTSTGRIVRMK